MMGSILPSEPSDTETACILLSQRMELIELEDCELLHVFRFLARPAS